VDQIAYFLTVFAASVGGLVWGILGGSMPGLSPSIAMALLLPFTYALPPVAAIVMLATCYRGGCSGSIPAILIRPRAPTAAAAVIDGYAMNAKAGGEALGIRSGLASSGACSASRCSFC
jgi:putative tricarboxylic transport membrane protein